MIKNSVLPQYMGSTEPMSGFAFRISEKQKKYLPIIQQAMKCPSEGTALNLLAQAEAVAVHNRERIPEEYLPTTDPKPFTVSYKYSRADKEALEFLQAFYKAPSRGDVVCHLLNQAILILDTKDGE